MASTDAKPIPIKNSAFRVTFGIFKSDGTLITSATALDSEVSKDGAAFADCTNEATEISQGIYYLDLTSTEMNADTVAVVVKTSSTGAVYPVFVFYPEEAGDFNTLVDDLLKRDMSAVSGESARSPLNALRLLRNKVSIAAGTLTVTKEDDATSAWTGAVTTSAGANPITAVDPA